MEDARSFYAEVLGERPRDIVPLDAQAVARGARPHWLGCIEVDDVDDATAAFLRRGATALGPKRVGAGGLEMAVLRGPGTAVVALAGRLEARSSAPHGTEGVWYQLNAIDVERAKEDYRAVLGWWFGEPMDSGEQGIFHPFAWHRGGATVGWMTDIFTRVGWHAHWLFHFSVADVEASMRAVRSAGGYVIGRHTLAGGERIAVCDDSQSAAFAIRGTPLPAQP